MVKKGLFVAAISFVFALTSCNSSNEDTKKVDDLNNAIADLDVDSISKPSDAITYLKDKKSVDIESITLSDNHYFTFNMNTKQFGLMDDNKIIYSPTRQNTNSSGNTNESTYDIFKITDYYDASSVYSQYLTSKFEGADTLLVTTGIDTGVNKNVKTLVYKNESGISKSVILNTYCDYLKITSSNDTVRHFGDANNVFISSSDVEYHEYGTIAYLQVSKGTIYLEKDSSTDLFEITEDGEVTTKQDSEANVIGAINADEITTQKKIVVSKVSSKKELDDAVSGTDNFIRLTDNIDYGEGSCLVIERGLFLDLNGKSLKFTDGIDYPPVNEGISGVKYPVGMRISNEKVNGELTCIIMDSQSYLYDRSGLYFSDCSFMVEGRVKSTNNEDNSVNLIINAGKIHNIKNEKNNAYACLVYGNCKSEDPAKKDYYNASVSMYGGYIKTEKGPKYVKDIYAFKCLQPRGKGAKVNMIYGDIESHHYCISGQGSYSGLDFELYGQTEINITGGTLKGGTEPEGDAYPYTPLFFPQSGTVNINGSKIIAPKSSCLNAKAGTITINNGTFIAGGNDEKAVAGQSGANADGSIFFIECNGYYHGGKVDLTVNGGTMLTNNRYVVRFSSYLNDETTSYANVLINGGTFTYKLDKYSADSKTYDSNYTFSAPGGTWTKL